MDKPGAGENSISRLMVSKCPICQRGRDFLQKIGNEGVSEECLNCKALIHYLFLVQVIKTPAGEAPKHIRDKWVGVQFCAIGAIMRGKPERPIGKTGGTFIRPQGAIETHVESALVELKKVSTEAANWFRENCHPMQMFLSFGADEVAILRKTARVEPPSNSWDEPFSVDLSSDQ